MLCSEPLRKLSNQVLSTKLLELRREERKVGLEILEYLVEVEERKLHLEQGYSSMHDFCMRRLGYSASAASRRIYAARSMSKFPQVYAYLHDGRATFSGIATVAGILTAENVVSVLAETSGKSEEEARAFVAKFRPKAVAVREQIRPVAVMAKQEVCTAAPLFASALPVVESNGHEIHKDNRRDHSIRQPVAETRFELRFSVSQETRKKLNEAMLLLSGKYPRGVNLEQVMDELLAEFLTRRNGSRKRKRATRPRTQDRGTSSRSIPAAVRREVAARDGGCCNYVSSEGIRCSSRFDLELDHVVPVAMGGKNTADNLRLLCRRHNILAAEKTFGREFMAQYAVG